MLSWPWSVWPRPMAWPTSCSRMRVMFGAVRKPSSAASSLRTTRPCVNGVEGRAVDDVGRRRGAAAADGEDADRQLVQRIAERDQADAEIAGGAVRILARYELDRHVPRAAEGQRDGRCRRIGPRNEGRAQLIVGVGALDRRGPERIAVPGDRLTAVRLLPAQPVAEQRERLVDAIAASRPPPPRPPALPSTRRERATPVTVPAARLNSSSPRDASTPATPRPPTTAVPPNRVSGRSPATAAPTRNAENPIDTVR